METLGPNDPRQRADAAGDGQQAGPRAGEELMTYEMAFARLQEVVQRLESGDAPLEEALQLFEEGVRMARLCSSRLDWAETRIRMIVEQEDGSLREVPLDDESKA